MSNVDSITVITPTWQRHDLLLSRCIPSVKAQTIPVEHVVVSDGPDPQLRELLAGTGVVYAELAEHIDDPLDLGCRARNRGLELADGDLVAYLDDDNAFRPNHVAVLAAAMADPAVDLAYSQMVRHGIGDIIGAQPPIYGSVDTSLLMHRRSGPERFGMWPDPAPSWAVIDWVFVNTWLEAGARWAFVPEITVDYYYKGAS
jgi:glycosyltransferase involved in cell wall biosynthesis